MSIGEECGVFGVTAPKNLSGGGNGLLWIVCPAAQRTGELRNRRE